MLYLLILSQLQKDISKGRLIGYAIVAMLLLCLPIGVSLLLSPGRIEYVRSNPAEEDPVTARLHDPLHPKYDYVRDAQDQERLRRDLAKVKQGVALDDVRKLLGPPSQEEILQAKPKPFHHTPRNKGLTYYFKRFDATGSNVRYDKLVQLFFDEKNHLTAIVSNVEGIATVPSN